MKYRKLKKKYQKSKKYKKQLGILRMRNLKLKRFHIYIRYYLRTARNDIDDPDKQTLLLVWKTINSSFWNNILWVISAIFQLQIFWEPNNFHSHILEQNQMVGILIIEILLLLILCIDILLGLYFSYQTRKKGITWWKQLIIQKKNISKIFLVLLFIIDLIYFIVQYFRYSLSSLRFGRCFRPFLLITYSKFLRRNLKGIFKSLQIFFILFIFFFVVFAFWAFIGMNLLGGLDDDIIIDKKIMDPSNYWNMIMMLFILSTQDRYPDIMQPSLIVSKYFLFYYLPFMILIVFIVLPIPMAIVYEEFKKHRIAVQLLDQTKQMRSIIFCYESLKEFNVVKIQNIKVFFGQLYKDLLTDEERLEFFMLIGKDDLKEISEEEFVELFQFVQQNTLYSLDKLPPLKIWIKIIKYFEDNFQLKQKLLSKQFALIMFIVILINTIFILMAFIIENDDILEVLDIIDKFFLGIYILEILLKVTLQFLYLFYKFIAFGFYNFFDDIWNKFDFLLVLFQFIFDFILIRTISANISNAVKVNRILRLTKLQKIFRIFRTFRTIRVFEVLFIGLDIFIKIKDLIYKILLCVPIVLQFALILWQIMHYNFILRILIYIYASLAIELFASNIFPQKESLWEKNDCSERRYSRNLKLQNQLLSFLQSSDTVDWSDCKYSDFDSMINAIILLTQIFIQADWASYMFDQIYKIDSQWIPNLFFISFMYFTIFQSALISGIVWEVFNLVQEDSPIDEQEEIVEKEVQDQLESMNFSCEDDRRNTKNSFFFEQIQFQDIFNYQDDFKYIFEKYEENVHEHSLKELPLSSKLGRLNSVQTRKSCLIKLDNSFIFQNDKIFENDFYKNLFLCILDENLTKSIKYAEYQKSLVKEAKEFFIEHGEKSNYEKQQLKSKSFQKRADSKVQDNNNNLISKKAQTDQFTINILYHFNLILSHEKTHFVVVLETLMLIEKILSSSILSSGSFLKFVFQFQSKWFYFQMKTKKISILEIGAGPWNELEGTQFYYYGKPIFDDDEQSTEWNNFEESLGHLKYSISQFSYQPVYINSQLISFMKFSNDDQNICRLKNGAFICMLNPKERSDHTDNQRKGVRKKSTYQFIKQQEQNQIEKVGLNGGLEIIHQVFRIVSQNKINLFKSLEDFLKVREEFNYDSQNEFLS